MSDFEKARDEAGYNYSPDGETQWFRYEQEAFKSGADFGYRFAKEESSKAITAMHNAFVAATSAPDEATPADKERMAQRVRIAELEAALKDVMVWINGWDPNFIGDIDWPETEERVRKALEASK